MSHVDIRHDALLPARAPYDVAASLRALVEFAPCTKDQKVARGAVRKAWALPDSREAVVTEVSARPDGRSGVAVRLYAARQLSRGECAEVEQSVAHWLGLDDDLHPFLAAAKGDTALAAILDEVAGLHQVRFPSLAEATVFFMLSQRSTPVFAAARKRRIAAEIGPRLTVDGEDYSAFPRLTELATLSVDELTPFAGAPLRRDQKLHTALAGLVELDEQWLRTGPYEDVRKALLAIKGVGEFTAHGLLLRALGRGEDLPLEMAQFADVAAAIYGDDVSLAEVRRRYAGSLGWWGYFAKTALSWRGVKTTNSTVKRDR
jgi:DNA-3-methyladenine glycosylase II